MDKKTKFPMASLIVCAMAAFLGYELDGGWSALAGFISIISFLVAITGLIDFLTPRWPQIKTSAQKLFHHLKEGIMPEAEAGKTDGEKLTPPPALPQSPTPKLPQLHGPQATALTQRGHWPLALMILIPSLVLFALVENEMPGWATGVLVASLVFLGWTGYFNILTYARSHPVRLLKYAVLYVVIGTGWSIGKWYFFVQNEHDFYRDTRTVFLKNKGVKSDTDVPEDLKHAWLGFYIQQKNVRDADDDDTRARYQAVTSPTVCDETVPTEQNLLGEFLQDKNVRFNWQENENTRNGQSHLPDYLQKDWEAFAAAAPKKVQEQNTRCLAVIASSIRPQAREHKAQITLWMTYWPWSATWTVVNDPVRRAFRWSYQRVQDCYEWISGRVFRDLDKDLPQAPTSVPPTPTSAT